MPRDTDTPVANRGAIDRGVGYLLAHQADDGYWGDWDLPPGESRMWPTAYVGYRLANVAGARTAAGQALDHAAQWLAAAQLADGGWGYNEAVGSDADSTALAILFLSARQRGGAPARAYERLRAFQRDDGGFATYTTEQSFGDWTASHPEVTGIALQALLTRRPRDPRTVARAAGYALSTVRPDGLWLSYWWATPLYATEANLQWISSIGHPWPARRSHAALLGHRAANALDAALQLLSLRHVGLPASGGTVTSRIETLVGSQDHDGGWPSEPMLLLPHRDSSRSTPGQAPTPRFADRGRTFTTATVVAALSAARVSMTVGRPAPA